MRRLTILLIILALTGCSTASQPVSEPNPETGPTKKAESPANEPVKAKKPKVRPKTYSFEWAAIKEEWKQQDYDRYILYYQEGSKAEKDFDKLVAELDKEYSFLAETFGNYPEKIKIYIHPYYDSSGYLGLAMATRHVLHVGYQRSFDSDIKATGTHELTHIFSSNWSNGHNIVLTEGLAKYFESLYVEDDVHANARRETRNKDISVLQLYKIYTNEWDNDYGYSYNVAGSFVKYLIDTFGMEKFEQMYKDKYLDFEVGFEQIYQKKLKDVEKGWLDHLHNQ